MYQETTGICRGGSKPKRNAGQSGSIGKWNYCKDWCDRRTFCGGYSVFQLKHLTECFTYRSRGVTGDGDVRYKCYMKQTGMQIAEI